ncbi:DUF3306 domain-containing protein [Marinobacter salicampi]|uniref:DUF3306 domain-containing protein n=1 Tax=Marinobacter salicampi TaxID=435907 RepID=UPI00140B9061|nr:DUF3306 domain-containing protein [Marinobacter salicampi]
MAESRLQRWSRKKMGASKESELPPAPPIEAEPSPEEQALAINEALPDREVLEKYGLPDPDAIELGTDITGFLRKEIPELLRRRALRSLWKSNPVLAVLDGLNDYDEDFTNAATMADGVQTLYKVGQGFDRTPKIAETADEQGVDQIQEQAEDAESAAPETVAGKPEPETAVEPTAPAHPADRVVAQAEAEPESVPRYRPRMRFDH